MIAERLGDPIAQNINTELFSGYRQKRLDEGITPNGVNREHQYFRAVFNELIRSGHWKKKNPIEGMRLFKIDERELNYLTEGQIIELTEQLKLSKSKDVLLVACVCLATGARWREASGLHKRHVRNNCISFTDTKSGKSRTVPIPASLSVELLNHKPESEGALFGECYKAFLRVRIPPKICQCFHLKNAIDSGSKPPPFPIQNRH